MASILGRNGELAISSTDSSYTDISKIKSISPEISTDIADETNNDSAGWKEGKTADKQMSLQCSGIYNSADAGQAELFTAAHAGTTKWFRWRPEDNSGVELEYRFQANISNLGHDESTGAVMEYSFSIQSTGAVTKATQP